MRPVAPLALALAAVISLSGCRRDVEFSFSIKKRGVDTLAQAEPDGPRDRKRLRERSGERRGEPGVLVAPVPPVPPVPPMPGAEAGLRVIGGDGGSEAFACRGDNVVVSGDRNQVALTGRCGVVTVPGDGNTLHVVGAEALIVPGDRNTVGYNEVARVTNAGEGNTLARIGGGDRKRGSVN